MLQLFLELDSKTMNKEALVANIKLMGMSLQQDETSNKELCPKCNGGSSRERSFNITRDGHKLKYMCHRASCKFYGIISSSGAVQTKPPVPMPKVFSYDTELLGPEHYNYLYSEFGLYKNELVDWRWSREIQRIIIPIKGIDGKRIGVMARLYPALEGVPQPRPQPKSLIYMEDPHASKIHFEKYDKEQKSFLLVEDMISAKKTARMINTIALLGTHIPNTLIDELLKRGIKDIKVALDKDAWGVAVKYKQEYGVLFRNFSLIPLSKDIKDMSYDKVQEIVYA